MSVINFAVTIGAFTLLSRIFGFLRECVMSAVIGTGMFMDCFLVALRLANTCRKIFAEGAFNASFVPRFMNVMEHKGNDAANTLLSQVFSLMIVSISSVVICTIIFYPSVLSVLASGFVIHHAKFELANNLGRIMFPFLIFISLTALFCGVANSIKKFAVPTIIYSILNVVSIFVIILGWFLDRSVEEITYMLAFGVVVAGMIQVAVMWWYLNKHGFLIKFTWNMFSDDVNDVLKNMVPGLVGAGVWQINLLIDMHVSSHLPTGTIACLNLADKLNQFPLATLGTAIGTAMLPTLSKAVADDDRSSINNELQSGILFSFLLVFPAVIILFTLSEPSVATAFQRGAFSGEYVKMTAQALQAFSVGLPAYILVKTFSAVFFAHKNTKKPTVYAIYSVIANGVLLCLLVPFGKHYSVALSTALSAYVNAFLLLHGVYKMYKIEFSTEFTKKFTIQLIAFTITFCVMHIICKNTWIPEYGDSLIKWGYFFVTTGITGIIYCTLIYIGLTVFRCKRTIALWRPDIWMIK